LGKELAECPEGTYWDGIGARVQLLRRGIEHGCGAHARYGVAMTTLFGEYYRLASCGHNVLHGLLHRFVLKTHDSSDWFVSQVCVLLAYFAGRLPLLAKCHPMTLAWKAGLSSEKGRRYTKANVDFRKFGVTEKHSRLSCFAKDENYLGDDPVQELLYEAPGLTQWLLSFVGWKKWTERIPRIINFRDWVWFVFASQWLLPFEHWLLRTTYQDFGLPPGGPGGQWIGKGKSLVERAAMLRAAWERYDDPYAFCIDGSKWDRQVSAWQLFMEAVFVFMCFWDSECLWMLLVQACSYGMYRNKGWIILYWFTGRRCSGDINTGGGNCLLFILILLIAFFDFVGGRWLVRFDPNVDGDDCVVINERSDFKFVSERIMHVFHQAGHNVTIEAVTDDFRKITWCQCSPIRVNGQWIMARKPWNIIGKAYVNPRLAGNHVNRLSHLYMVALGEAVLGRGVPVIQTWARGTMQFCMANGAKPFKLKDTSLSVYRALKAYLEELGFIKDAELIPDLELPSALNASVDHNHISNRLLEKFAPIEVSMESREDYYVAFGISPSRQLELERNIPFPDLRQPLDVGWGTKEQSWYCGW